MSGFTMFLISEWVIRLSTVIYVPQRRSPAAARTWLLLIFLVPWPGLIAYFLFGHIALPRSRMLLHARIAERIAQGKQLWYGARAPQRSPPTAFQPIATLAEALGGFPALPGNQAELLVRYGDLVARLVSDIDAATSHVHLLYYIFALDEAGNAVCAALLRATQRKVACRLVLDSVGSRAALKVLPAQLAASGIEIVAALPTSLLRRTAARFDLRNHRKLAIIDGRTAYIGSQNLVQATDAKGVFQSELVARVQGPVVAEFQVVFLADHNAEVHQVFSQPALFPAPAGDGPATMQALPSGPAYGQANFKLVAQALIQAARERVFITTPYLIPDEAFLECLHTAVLRGVAVTLMVSLWSDSHLVSWAEQSFFERMLQDGVQIHLYAPAFLHAKHMSIDGQVAIIGSSNLDIRSFTLNNEISLIIYDAAFVRGLAQVEADYVAHSEVLTAAAWGQRRFLHRIGQNMMRLADALL